MTDTDSLIDELARGGAAPPANALPRFIIPLAAAGVACALGVALALEGAFAAVEQSGINGIVIKWGFSIALLLLSAFALWAMGKPGRRSGGAMAALTVPFGLVGVLLVVDLLVAEPHFPGETWRQCLAAMGVMSPVAFAGAIVATRWLAPTNLRRAGLAAGLFGGAVAMTAYAPYCTEHGMLYMAVFYCLPILVMAALGWLLGPRLLRW